MQTLPSEPVAMPFGEEALPNLKPAPVVRRLTELQRASENDENTLLGNRFLCRGGGLLVVGSAGIGKSTAVMQMGISWSLGKTVFGMNPARVLKLLYVQAENDEGDLCEMRDGVIVGLSETEDIDGGLLEENFLCVHEESRTGEEFIDALEALLREHRPDLLIIDPALSYLGGSTSEQKDVTRFLRNLLNPLLRKYNCGVLIVHHTNKPNADKDKGRKLDADFAYAATGSSEWGNWARGVLVLQAKDNNGLRALQIGKRFGRLGWVDENGEPTTTKWLQQSAPGQGLFYTEVSPEVTALRSSKTSPLDKVLLHPTILPAPGEEIAKNTLIARITGAKLCGRDTVWKEVLPLLEDQGYLDIKKVPRAGAKAEVRYVRTQKRLGFQSFVHKEGS